ERPVRSEPAPRVVVSATAPRGRGDASDLAPGGVHAGELDLADAVAPHVPLVVHPQIGAAPSPGRIGYDTPTAAVVASGVADAAARYDDAGRRQAPTALLVTAERTAIGWEPIAPSASDTHAP